MPVRPATTHAAPDVLRCVVWLCLWLLCGSALAQDDPPGRVGRIAALQGEVWVYEAEPGEWAAALRNRPVTSGDRFATAAGGGATLQIGSTTLVVGASSELEVLQLDDEAMRFRLEHGSVALRVRSREVASELMVANFEGRFQPLTAGLFRIDRLDERSDATVWRGEMQFESPDLRVVLGAGQRLRFWQDGQPLATRSIALAPLDDDFAQAVLREDQALARDAASPFVPLEMTGTDDLDRYGQWQQHPEYGAVWSPTSVAIGWVPYRHGRWVWLRPWGWTWVDDAPWGFAPFHYGRWFWWGRRWAWAPGPMVRRPVYAPALVAWTGTLPPGAGSAAPVFGWVPLAPRETYRPDYRASPGHVNRLNPHAPLLRPPEPGYGNRAVPGAVTMLPAPALRSGKPVADAALRPGTTVAPPAWRDVPFQPHAPPRPPWPAPEQIAPRPASPLVQAPRPDRQRPPPVSVPEPVRPPDAPHPGAGTPLPGAPTGPFFGRPTGAAPPQRALPTTPRGAPVTEPAALPAAAPPAVATGQTTGDVAPRRPPGAPPHQASPGAPPTGQRGGPQGSVAGPPVAPVAPAAPPAVVPAAPIGQAAPHPFKPAPPAAAAAPTAPKPRVEAPDNRDPRSGGDPGERRRTPDSRQKQIER